MAVSNQWIIVKKENTQKDVDNPYTRINNKAMEIACNNLTEYGLKLWLYLSRNQNESEWDLSTQALQNWAGGSDKSWRNAREQLMKEKYLKAMGDNRFEFYELPEVQPIAQKWSENF